MKQLRVGSVVSLRALMVFATLAVGSCAHNSKQPNSAPDGPSLSLAPSSASALEFPEPKSIESVVVAPGVVAWPRGFRVEVEAVACLDSGWLEQIACSPSTREHESLVVVKAKASEVHAAMLVAGFSNGSPGRWSHDGQKLSLIPPTGDQVAVDVEYVNASGQVVREPIESWIRVGLEGASPPSAGWVFAGSAFAKNPEFMGPGEHYVADMTGSIIGLVTFGGEVIGYREVHADQAQVQEPEWMVNEQKAPPPGTKVKLILRRPGASG